MERFGWKLGDRITIMGDIFPVDLTFTIRAVYDAPRDTDTMFFHYKYLSESTTVGRDTAGIYLILVDDPKNVPRIAREVDALFRNSPAETKTETERAFEVSFLSYLGNVKVFLISLCAAVTFMLLLVSGNTMAMVVRERVKEIGVLKTLGFTPGGVLWIMLFESVLISLIGAAVGLAGSFGMCHYIASGPMTFADLKLLHVPGPVVLIVLGIGIVIAVIGTLIPAWAAVRRPIVDCLRVVD
jgi:putative ABC transport system permease protein